MIALLVFLGAVAVVLLRSMAGKVDSFETVRIGMSSSALNGLVFIAKERSFFEQHGLRIIIDDAYETCSSAAEGLIADEVDISGGAEFVMVQNSFDHADLRTFAQIAMAGSMEMIAMKDRGIAEVSDLKGKKVGLTIGSSSQYFLCGFLTRNKLPLSAVDIVNLGPPKMKEALLDGFVDAVVTWEPQVTRIKKRLGTNAASWPVQGRDDYYFLLMTKEDFLQRSPATDEKVLQALIDAEGFAGKHPEEAARIIESYVRSFAGDVQLILQKTTLHVRLDQSLLRLMEAEAHWMIRNKMTPGKEMPNYFNMIHWEALEIVKPESVGIFH